MHGWVQTAMAKASGFANPESLDAWGLILHEVDDNTLCRLEELVRAESN